jgi:hypothetical protein
MQFARRFANSAGLAQALAAFDCMPAWAEAAMTGDQPGTVAAVAEENTPAKVFVGVYIDDIQELDLLNFGDLSEPEATDYSRLTLSIPVSRPGGGHGDQDLRANRAHRRLRCARVLRAAPSSRGADRLGPHGPAHPRRAADHLGREPARFRLSEPASPPFRQVGRHRPRAAT